MGRLERLPWVTVRGNLSLDGIGNGLGYGIILVIVGFIRELFGSGTLFGISVIPGHSTIRICKQWFDDFAANGIDRHCCHSMGSSFEEQRTAGKLMLTIKEKTMEEY